MSDIHRRLRNIENILGNKSTGTHCETCGHHDCWKRNEDHKCEVCGPVRYCIKLGGKDDCPHDHDFKCGDCGFESKTLVIKLGGELHGDY